MEEKAIAGPPPERADMIIAGATILLPFLLRFGSNRIWVSRHELRYRILFERSI
jgi:exopolyphosphatase/pppGpp-phosphohydrolase